MKCPLCMYEGDEIFTAVILEKYNVKYFKCKKCEMIFTESPYWLGEAYDCALTTLDTGAILRNIQNAIKVNYIIEKHYEKNGIFLDYGSAYGVFVRMMRDTGCNFVWYDKYAQNLYAQGFSWNQEKIDMLVSFEVFEHMDNPAANIKSMFDITNDIIFSTELYTNPEFPAKSWNYYARQTGQHICFYNVKTLQYIAEKYRVHCYTVAGIHWFTKKKIEKNVLEEMEKDIDALIRGFNKISKMDFKHCVNDQEILKA